MPTLVSRRRTAVWMRRLQQARGLIQLVDKDMKSLRPMVSIPMSFDSGFVNGHNVRGRVRGDGDRDRRRRRDDRDSDDDDESVARPGKGGGSQPPEWDGVQPSFQDWLIKARLWIATTRARPKTQGPLILQRLSGQAFQALKHLARDAAWLQDDRNGHRLLDLMDTAEMFGDDKEEDLLASLSKLTYHFKRHKDEDLRVFFRTMGGIPQEGAGALCRSTRPLFGLPPHQRLGADGPGHQEPSELYEGLDHAE